MYMYIIVMVMSGRFLRSVMSLACYRWIGIYAELIGDLIILCTALFAVLSKGSIDAGLVGLSLSYAMSVRHC